MRIPLGNVRPNTQMVVQVGADPGLADTELVQRPGYGRGQEQQRIEPAMDGRRVRPRADRVPEDARDRLEVLLSELARSVDRRGVVRDEQNARGAHVRCKTVVDAERIPADGTRRRLVFGHHYVERVPDGSRVACARWNAQPADIAQ